MPHRKNSKKTKEVGAAKSEADSVEDSKQFEENLPKGFLIFHTPHIGDHPSLLSSASSETNFRGFFNLICLVVVCQNIRLILTNFLKYGFLVTFFPNSVSAVWQDVPAIGGFILVYAFPFASVFVERHGHKLSERTLRAVEFVFAVLPILTVHFVIHFFVTSKGLCVLMKGLCVSLHIYLTCAFFTHLL
eukprot:Platyproteum_vivax@DN1347_c0_g1_i2.p1